ncbi:hypothetical protein ACETIH_05445 [Microvirga arabica]|uniref:Uncharacterized protein n=1 Tax=Microvirga arabica TaxID=1128671 RepID=A0ABV6Y4I3_9HYPH
MQLLRLGRCTLELSRPGERLAVRFLLIHKRQNLLCPAREDERLPRAEAELLVAGITQHRHQIPEQMDQKITIAAGAKGCLFGGIPVSGD